MNVSTSLRQQAKLVVGGTDTGLGRTIVVASSGTPIVLLVEPNLLRGLILILILLGHQLLLARASLVLCGSKAERLSELIKLWLVLLLNLEV